MPRSLANAPAYGAVAAPLDTSVAFWRGMFQLNANAALWWSRKWLAAPKTFLAWSPMRYAVLAPAASAVVAPKTVAAIIDLAQAAAARAAAELATQATQVVEIAETAAEVPVSVAEDAVSIATVAAEVLEPEDLTRLVGVGPKLAVALAERGVTRYAQIAGWTADDLAEVDKALDLKGRAVRDAWVAQAKRFAAEKA